MKCPFYKRRMCSKVVTYEYYPSFFQLKEYCMSEMDSFKKCPFYKFGPISIGLQKPVEVNMSGE